MKKKYDKTCMQVLNKLALLADGDIEQSFQSRKAQQALAHFLQVYHPDFYTGEDLPRGEKKRRKTSPEQWMYKHYEWWLALGVIVGIILLYAYFGG
jgi:hypothetical protein